MKISILILTIFIIANFASAELPASGIPVKTKFDCSVRMGEQNGSDYKSVMNQISVIVDTDFEEVIKLDKVLNLPSHLVGGFISMSAADFNGEKISKIAVRTPSLKVLGSSLNSQDGDSATVIDGATLKAWPNFTISSDLDNSEVTIINVEVICKLEEI